MGTRTGASLWVPLCAALRDVNFIVKVSSIKGFYTAKGICSGLHSRKGMLKSQRKSRHEQGSWETCKDTFAVIEGEMVRIETGGQGS